MASYEKAREGITGRNFQAQALGFLERIAVALESQVEGRPHYEPIDPIGRAIPLNEREQALVSQAVRVNKPLVMKQTDVCTCGNDYTRICTQCTASRLAQAYSKQEEE